MTPGGEPMRWKIAISLLLVLAAALFARSFLWPGAEPSEADPLSPAVRSAGESDTQPAPPAGTAADGRSALAPDAPRDGEEAEAPPSGRDGPTTAAERLARYRDLARRDPAALDAAAEQALASDGTPLAERVALLRAAWIERTAGWERIARAALETERDSEALGRAVERWAAEDAPRDPVARSFLEDALWGEAPVDAQSRTRRRLARSLFAAAPPDDLPRLRTWLHGEADTEVLRSALIAWAVREDEGRAEELFAPFGLEPPADLGAVEGD